MKKSLFIGITILIMLFLAENAFADDVIEFTFFHRMNEMTDYIQEFLDKYNEEHSGIVITQEVSNDANALKIKYATGDDPEIVMGPQTQEFFDLGKYVDLNNYPELIEKIDPDILQVTVDLKTGANYRLPIGAGSYGFYYNRQMFADLGLEKPANWDEFMNVCAVIKENLPDVIPFYSVSLGHQVHYWALGLGMRDAGMVKWNTAAVNNDQSVLQFRENGNLALFAKKTMEMKELGYFDPEIAVADDYQASVEDFGTGKAAMLAQGLWWYGSLASQFPEQLDNVGFFAIPALDGTGVYGSKDYDSCISISSSSPYRDELVEFLMAWFSYDNANQYCTLRGVPSAVLGVVPAWGPEAFVNDVQAIFNNEECGVVQTESPTGFYTDEVASIVQELLVGIINEDEFADRFADAWDEAFSNQ